ncbi:MAG: transposase family protein, partial [Erysipelotrichaceae bacterium]|nr:transposase family protein [Erysipelotrichaceae bacterium]
MSKGIIQKERRNLKNVHPAVSRFARIIGHIFPHFPEMLDNMEDPRHPSYITYPQSALIMLVLMKCVSGIDSMRGMTREFNTDEAIHNLSCLCKHKLEEKSDWQTVNNYLELLDPKELQEIIQTLVRILIRTKAFTPYTILGRYPVLIDGTDYAYFRKKHSEHDLVKKTVDKETGEVTYQYFNKALEAKILLAPGLLISIATEFIENEDENVSKQDCELNAGYRLIRKLKKCFPKLDIIIIGDALYAVMPFMKAVKENRWDYIFRVKAGRQSKLMEDFDDLLTQITEDSTCREVVDGEKGTARFVNHVEEVTDKSEICNMVHYMYRTEQAIKDFNWVSSIEITQKNVKSVVKAGRSRWLEEAGFNVQKNGIFVLEHHCSHDYNAMKNHYLLIQIAHMFMQLYMSYDHVVFKLKEGIKHTAADL